MTSKILALLLLSANFASADDRTPPTDDLEVAVARGHDASARERYNAQLATIAERDIVTAQITRDLALNQWQIAMRANQEDDAHRWARRHSTALRDEQEAQARAARYARERDDARADFEVSAAKVRKLSARASR